MPNLFKIVDGKRQLIESGNLCEAIRWNEDRTFKESVGNKPVVGCSMRVGSRFARSFSAQDWWLTTEVTEIVSEKEIKEGKQLVTVIQFKTKNSTYELAI